LYVDQRNNIDVPVIYFTGKKDKQTTSTGYKMV
jgi:hypothetical protein